MAKRDQPPAEPGAGSAADGDPEPAGSRRQALGGRQLPKVAAVFLAAAATGVLILSDDPRLLRLGLLAALWGALLAAFAVARARRLVGVQERRLAEQRRVHERELEREAAARRECESRAVAETRREVAAEYEQELWQLRGELQRLSAAAHRAAGDERVRLALSAEAGGARSGDGEAVDRHAAVVRAVDTHELPVVVAGRADSAPRSDAQSAAAEPVRSAEDSGSGLAPVARSAGRRVPGRAARVQGQAAATRSAPPGRLPEPPRQAVGNEWSSPGIAAPGHDRAAGGASAAEVSTGGNPADASGAGPGAAAGASAVGPGAAAGAGRAAESGGADSAGAVVPGGADSAEDPEAGAHTAGTSVTELLAAYGDTGTRPGRRRRRG
ncbi:DUF6779 domain-containing protein [Bounagaea algeriensis]